jgi:phage tail-like protein
MSQQQRSATPYQPFNFQVEFQEVNLADGTPGGAVRLCGGSFAEVTGIEATMEPKVIKQVGHNFGDVQRAGPVTFSTVILKRGVTKTLDLWNWFNLVAGGSYARRLTAKIHMLDPARQPVHVFELRRALAAKFKAADFSATATAIAIEELHIVYEELVIQPGSGGTSR